MMAVIEKGTPCNLCGIPMMSEDEKPTVIETDEGQLTVHWDCLTPGVQKQVEDNQRKMMARFN